MKKAEARANGETGNAEVFGSALRAHPLGGTNMPRRQGYLCIEDYFGGICMVLPLLRISHRRWECPARPLSELLHATTAELLADTIWMERAQALAPK